MPHADTSLIPENIQTKTQFWAHIYEQLQSLLDGQRTWVTNLANASSLIYNSLQAFPVFFGSGDRAVNWCGFYVDAPYFPLPKTAAPASSPQLTSAVTNKLLLGPFCGKPACQFINTTPGKARGVCADAFIERQTKLVPDVDSYPGHIACDGETRSEIVCPLLLNITTVNDEGGAEPVAVGVLDLDCLAIAGFSEEDRVGLEKIARLVVDACDW